MTGKLACACALIAVCLCLAWLSQPVVVRGPSSADDAYFALAAKTLASGDGYGAPQGDGHVMLFDPLISTGPPVILPVALSILAFGSVEWLPGAVTLLVFVGQMVVAAGVLATRFGGSASTAFMSVLLILLMLASRHNWYFGSLLGEPPAFGFLLIGAILLAVNRSTVMIAFAAVSLSLAFMTKHIALFAAVGIIGAWVLVLASDRAALPEVRRRLSVVLLAAAMPPVTFEVAKLLFLGWQGYLALWDASMASAVAQGIGSGDTLSRVLVFWSTLTTAYISPFAACLLLISAASLIIMVARAQRGRSSPLSLDLAVLAGGGALAHFSYVVLMSTLWPRFYWIGIAVACCGVAAPVLALGRRERVGLIIAVAVVILAFDLHKPLVGFHQGVRDDTVAHERAEVVRLLDENSTVPFAAQWWSSLFDILFLKKEKGEWAYGPAVEQLRNRTFIALTHRTFTDTNSGFFQALITSCEILTPGAQKIAAYRCGESFWVAWKPGS
ncbi:MAG: hypothetical protein ACRESZ_08640 [Methylococcales bacterium]